MMRSFQTAMLCATLALAPAACTRQQTTAAPTADNGSAARFEMTPAIGAATGATVVVALGITLIIACGIACFN